MFITGSDPHEFKENYLGHPKHIALARQAVRESLVLLKNNNRLLPLNPKQHIGIIGDAAKNQVSLNTSNTVFDAKRLIGKKFNDETVQNDAKHFPFKIVNMGGGKTGVRVEYKEE